MRTLFDDSDRQEILTRLVRLTPDAPRQWGKMEPAQMLAHCAGALEMVTDAQPRTQRLLGKLVTPFIWKSVFASETPLTRNSPTDPSLVVGDPREFAEERARLTETIETLARNGRDAAGRRPHRFFGKLSGDEWGVLCFKHLDHHLRQFGV